MNHAFPHQKLRVWHEAKALVQMVAAKRIGDCELRDQATRAVKSVVLNIAEGAALDGGAARKHFTSARASAAEVVAAYEIAAMLNARFDAADIEAKASLVSAMLYGLITR